MLRRVLVWLAGIVIACFCGAFLALNLYVQSQATQARLQQEISQRIGLPFHIQRSSATPWGGLRFSGIQIPQSEQAGAPLFATAESVGLRVKLHSIIRQPLVIKNITVTKPSVTWRQNEAGQWRWPASPRAGGAFPGGAMVSPPDNASPVFSGSAQTAATIKAGRNRGTPLPLMPNPQVQRIQVVDGAFRFLDRSGSTLAFCQGVQFSSTVRQLDSIHGEARVARVTLRDRIALSNIVSSVRYNPSALELPAASAQLAHGQVSGRFFLRLSQPNSPFFASAEFQNVHADELIVQAGGSPDVVHGTIDGSFKGTGTSALPESLKGEASLVLHGGQFQQIALLAALGQILQIDELTQLNLDQAEAKLHVEDERLRFDEIVLRSPNLRLTGAGSTTFNGKLALDATLAINDKVRDQLFRGMRENFTATNEPGLYALDFHVGGTWQRPHTDLMEKAMGTQLRDLSGVVDALFGRGKGKRKKKGSEPRGAGEAAPTMGTPEPSPTPASSVSP